ncbi:MAG: phosphomannomutase/phosphoglucomutase [Cycloclasticus sp.]|nr:MAG: phosphomannomutase/phosphoglucomutase [Cycloclasticus sp.]
MKKVFLIILVLVSAVGIAGYIYIGVIDKQGQEKVAQLQVRVNKTLNVMSLKVNKWRQKIEILAKDEELIASLDKAAQPEKLQAWIEKNRSSIDDLLMLRVLRPGLMTVDVSISPPLDYAGLELMRKAVSSKKTQMPEVHMMSRDERHIAIVVPVLKADEPIAVVLASLAVEPIKKIFQSSMTTEKGGWLALKQGPLVIVSGGDRTQQTGDFIDGGTVLTTSWKVDIRKRFEPLPIAQRELIWYLVFLVSVISVVGLLANVFGDEQKRKKIKILLNKVSDVRKAKVTAKIDAELAKSVEGEEPAHILSVEDLLVKQRILDAIKKGEEDSKEDTGQTMSKPDEPAFIENNNDEVDAPIDIPQSIFRAYDIRGIVDDTLTEAGVYLIGCAIASEAITAGQSTIVIARDGRTHSPRLSESLAKGIQSKGCNVIDIGQVPTPVLYFATHNLDTQSGVMITGSHNPKNYNGLKIVIAGDTLSGEAIQSLYKRIDNCNFEQIGEGSYEQQMMLPEYIGAVTSDVRMGRMIKVVVDCGNGVAGEAAPMLLSTLGCDVVPLYCEVDGNFPNHHPDPSKPENLQELIAKVREEEAELGLAFDGDGDRLGVVDSEGNIIWPDRQMMLYAIDVLSRQAGADILYDVKCTRNLAKVIAKHGGKPMMCQTGHSLIKAKMKETNAELAGEMSGHIFFKERWYGFDDALYTAARLLEIISAEFRSTAEVFAALPNSVSTPELNIGLQEGENFTFIEQLQSQATFDDAKIITIDGLRVEFKDGWGLVRASNTTPTLVLRFEADDEQGLERIKQSFREQMLKINADIELPF